MNVTPTSLLLNDTYSLILHTAEFEHNFGNCSIHWYAY